MATTLLISEKYCNFAAILSISRVPPRVPAPGEPHLTPFVRMPYTYHRNTNCINIKNKTIHKISTICNKQGYKNATRPHYIITIM